MFLPISAQEVDKTTTHCGRVDDVMDSKRKSRLKKEVQIETTTEVTHSEWVEHFTNLKADKHAFLTKSVGTYKKVLTLVKKPGERKIPHK